MTNIPSKKTTTPTRRPDCVTGQYCGSAILTESGYFKRDTTDTAADKMVKVLLFYVCSEKLIVISSQGQSVINCETSKKTYCGENYDKYDLIALAEELGDEIVPIAGDGGGGLQRYSKDKIYWRNRVRSIAGWGHPNPRPACFCGLAKTPDGVALCSRKVACSRTYAQEFAARSATVCLCTVK